MAKPTRAFAPVMVGQAAASGSLSVAAPFGAGTSAQRLVRVLVMQVGTGLGGDTLPTPTIGGVALTPIGTQFALSSDQGIARLFGLLGASIPGNSPSVAISGANVNRRLQMWVLGYEGATQCIDGAIASSAGTPVAWTVADADSDADSIIDIPLASTHQTSGGGNPWTAPLPAVAGASGSTVVDQAAAYAGCYRQLVVQEDAAATGATDLGLAYTSSQFGASETIGPTLVVRGAVVTGGTITSNPLVRNTGTASTDAWALWGPGQAFTVWVHHLTTGALLVKRTGLLTNASGVFSFTDAGVPAAASYRVDIQHEATGVWGVDILNAI